MSRIPIRWRLLLGYTLITGILFLALGFFIHHLVKRQLYNAVDQSLYLSAQAIRDAKFAEADHNSEALEDLLSKFLGDKSIKLYALLFDVHNNKTRIRTKEVRLKFDVTPVSVKRAQSGQETFETFNRVGSHPIRQLTMPVLRSGRFSGEIIQVGTSLEPTTTWLKSLNIVLGTTFPLSLLLALFVGYLMASRSLRPISQISRAAAKIQADDLSKRLPLPPARDELHLLTNTFNSMLERLQMSFSKQRRFTGDVSHELRTSLAVLLGESEFALRKERSASEYAKSLKLMNEECQHMSQIVEDLLLLSRAQNNALNFDFDEINPEDFFESLRKIVDKFYVDKNIRLEIENKLQTPFKANQNYLLLIIKNLLLNAAKHSQPGQIVILTAMTGSSTILFKVKDFGAGIPTNALEHIFDAFYRADTARNRTEGGAGIGLSLAQALTKLHQGKILVESEEGKGSLFTLELPQLK